MIIILSSKTTSDNVADLKSILKDRGYDMHLSEGVETTIVGAVGASISPEEKAAFIEQVESLHYVDKVVPISKPYKIVNKQFHPERTVVEVRGVKIGDPTKLVVMAGPCTVETWDQRISFAAAPTSLAPAPTLSMGMASRLSRCWLTLATS